MVHTVNTIFIILCLLASIHRSHGNCVMENVNVWQLPISERIEDYFDGIILQRTISNIVGYDVLNNDELNGGPYVDISIESGLFILRTNQAYREYEENETNDVINFSVIFRCADGTNTIPLMFQISINDNNNNDPLFKTPDTPASADTTFDFTIVPPVPPGFHITDCVRDIIVRDIDLTTYRIDFGIEDNPYFEIEYDEASSTVPKEFKALLRTTTLIRNISEPIVLRISATDVDLTGDPAITTYTTVTIHGSSEFELPLEPVFSRAFYIANYNENDQVTLEEPISLQQGYDTFVEFSLEGDYADEHFELSVDGNEVSLSVKSALPTEAYRQGQILLAVNANREYTSGASSTIVVQLPEAVNLEFERPNYEGEIVDNALQLTQLVLSQGYQGSPVTVTVEDYPSFFTASVVGNIITLSMAPLDSNIIEENNFINIRVTASTDYSSATAIVTLEIIKDDIETPVFGESLYSGTYDSTVGLTLGPILLTQGYDETVQITHSGEHGNYFELVRDGPTLTLRVIGTGLPALILREQHLLLTIRATKPRTVGATTVVSISLPGARELRFEAPTYSGFLQDNTLTLENMTLSVGYDEDVVFELSGNYVQSFMVSSIENQVTISLSEQLPQEVIAENNFLIFTLTATGVNALPGSTAVLLEIIKDDATTPVFSQAIYYGDYLGSSEIEIGNINLIQGYDDTVSFRIEGDNSQYFQISQNAENVSLSVLTSIPEEVILNEKVFVFNIFADKPLTVGANAAISIKFSEDLTEPTLLQFTKNTYTGTLEDNLLTLENIVLETGYAAGTQFELTGDYALSFTTTVADNVVSLSLSSTLSTEILENNKFIVLELEARRERAVSVFTSIIIDIVKEEIPEIPIFSQAYYTGVYTEDHVLQFSGPITLTQGYDNTVTFGLEGELSTWFTVTQNGNSVNLVSTSNVPQNILDDNTQLLFTVVAYKPNAINGESAISIDLPKEITELEVLRFAQSSYEGQIDGSDLRVPTILLTNDVTDHVDVEVTGVYASYFRVFRDLSTVNVELLSSLPPEVISDSEFLILDITASKLEAINGYTTLILSIVKEPQIVTPVFEQAYYTGEFSNEGGLLFEHTIRLIQGFDESVSFTLGGDGSEWFTLTQNGQNSLSLAVVEGVQQIENINHLIFYVMANKDGSIPGQAAIVIHLTDVPTATPLRFSQTYYEGAIQDNTLTMELISLAEGYSNDVEVALRGDYADYFQLLDQSGTYTLTLTRDIPSEVIETNNLLILTVEANLDDTKAHATIVIELIKPADVEIEEILFDETYYASSFSAATGNMTDIQIRIINGYDSNVVFILDGDNNQLFEIQRSDLDSSVTIALLGPIPIEIFEDNQPLIFVLNANKPGARGAQATVIITLDREFTADTILGFERPSYLGTIEDGVSTLDPIVLTEGYTTAVEFTLHGDLSNYFRLDQQGATVNVVLQTAIPEELLPTNRIILLEVRATALQLMPAVTTIVFEIIWDQDAVQEELIFSAPYYTGEFSEAGGLVFQTTITLDEGYDQNVQFDLEGEHAQWFTLQVQGNSATLTVSGAIPPATLVNNHQLVFFVTAQKPNSNTARATIVISLVDEFTADAVLGFERPSYLGTIEDGVSTLDPIVLTEGYTTAVEFTLHGDLSNYFRLDQQGATVNVVLQTAIPDESLPTNRIIVLEVRATALQLVPAVTTVVFENILDQDAVLEELVFSAPYYTGQFSEAGGLVFQTTITLDEGYDQNVQLDLEGEHAQWFTLQVQGNSATLTVSGAIPPATLVNNHQLVFFVTAQKPNSNTARATIVISLVDEFTADAVLGFERPSYLGTIVDGISTLDPIVLTEGYTTAVEFTLHGDLSNYFRLDQQGATVNIVLQTAIPDESLPTNRIIVLEVRATALQLVPAVTTVVFEIVQDQDAVLEELVFSAPYYTGQFSEAGGLVFQTTITLDEGYDQNVQFDLEGEHAQWFTLQVQGNSATLTVSGAIPPATLVNNHQLVFFVTAQKPNSNTARATIVISLVDEFTADAVLGFERPSYLGTIVDGISTLDPIVLTEGYTTAVEFTLHGDLSNYFRLDQQGATVNVVLQTAIPDESLPTNRIILLEVRATALQLVPAVTTVVFENILDQDAVLEELVFSAPYYTGQFSEAGGLVFQTTITLDEGYDQNVQFNLEGEPAQWFTLQVQGNSATLTVSGAIPPATLVNNHQLVFFVTAQKLNSNTARATIVISLVDEFTADAVLGFERPSYLGTIVDGISTLDPIVLTEGYTTAVEFTLYGDLSNYFRLDQQGATVNVVLQTAIPDESLPTNRIILLEVRATALQLVPAVTTVVFENILDQDAVLEELVFSAPYYTGQFSEAGGLVFQTTITLDEGYDQNVQFDLEGEHAQWFTLQVQGNSATLTVSGAIPPATLVNNHQLVFFVTAQKPNSNTARATIVISLVDEFTADAVLGFERPSYLGTIEDGVSTLDPIVLTEGYTTAVEFTLHGDLSNYFRLDQQGATVNIVLQTAIPDESLPTNRIIVLEVRATALQLVPAVTTVVFEIVQDQDAVLEELVFSAPYYTGQFSEAGGLVFQTTITLDEGYDQNVQFDLEGEHAQWFTLQVQGNSATLTVSGAIPPATLVNNHQLVFFVTAQKPNSNTARATIVISLVDEFTADAVLGFERPSYLGTIEDGVSTLDPIVLTEGYTTAVEFTLHGDLSNYFRLDQQGATVNIVLQTAFPDESLPTNRIIVLEVRATALQLVPAVTTVVFEIVQDQDAVLEELVFSAPYYTGQFSEAGGLVFQTTITLDEGYDQNVQFDLEGEHAQWFTLQVQGNSATLTVSGAIPPATLVNNHQLVFFVTAQKPNSSTARATIVISLVDEFTADAVLGFERPSYLGTIEDGVSTLDPIVLTEGYTTAVEFTLHGDLSNYFRLDQQGATVNIVLQTAIPDESLPTNRIIVLEVRATALQLVPAVTTVVFEIVQDQDAVLEELVFSAPYYTGQFSEAGGLVFQTTITLDEGYDQNVQFDLEGEHAQWFTPQVQGNSATLTVSGAIPPATLVNNHQLVFFVTAQKPNSNTARATIVISLVDEFTADAVLGFERPSYLGTIENGVSTLDPIVLTEGYTTAVEFTLHGDLSNYFRLDQQGATVNIVLQTALPDESLPTNRIIVLEVRATALQLVPAVTTVVFEIVQDQDAVLEELVFSAPYYTGQFSEAGGLVFQTTITLDEGYDQNVQFDLEGEHAQWFTLQVQGNSATLTVSGAIPPATLVNNHQLVFFVTAQKPNSSTARATIVISLVDEFTADAVLGFERPSYLGTIEDGVSTLDPIVLTEGYTTAVEFTLHGDLSNYFRLDQQGATVNIVLQTAIPDESLSTNRIIVLEVRATALQLVPAVTTVVFEIVQDQDAVLEELVFSAPYYTGQFSEAGGLVFQTTITLDEGYDQNVQFDLEGEHAQWFTLQVQGNSATLTVSGAIPPATLVNNHQLVFFVTAQKPNSNTARATIVISLVDEFTADAVLGFERPSYLGTIVDGISTLDPIVLTEGYTTAVEFTLHGDLSNYFRLDQQGATVNVVLQTAIPDESLPTNRIIVLEVRATALQLVPAVTTVVFENILDQDAVLEELVFSAPYYTGQFSEAGGLVFQITITLDEGYDQNVQFDLEGEHAQWFTLQVQGNSATLTVSGAIPPATLVNNHQLVFFVTAQKPNSNTARATIVISLVDEFTADVVLGFERSSYLGTIEDGISTLDPIVLIEGYTTAVEFTLHGDLSNYFRLDQQGATVNVVLQTAIPDESLPTNRIIVLEVRATALQLVPAVTTVVFENILDQDAVLEELVFSAPYYTGQFSEAGGLVFQTTITLDEGYDQNVQFDLEGENALWFTLQVQGNTATLTVSGAIPPATLFNNHQLVFFVTAQKPNSNTARATIVISLVDEFTADAVLGFQRSSYLGTIEDGISTLDPIVLTEGYTTAVEFTLHGDLSNYFRLDQQGATVNVVLQTSIPDESLPTNRILVLEVRATALQLVPAVTTVVFEIVQDQDAVLEELVFSAPYYTGQFSEAGGLVFQTTITLDEGYDQNVQFDLEGENALWFTLQVQGNTATLTVSGAIPPATLFNNHQLVFFVTAQKPNSNTARATIVISLVDEFTADAVLGFERSSYLGTIEDGISTLDPIVLTEGYTTAVEFTLHGDLSNYFRLDQQGATANVVLQTSIPDESLPTNRILVLEVRATALQLVPAVTTVVFEIVQDQDAVLEELVFSAPYYTGQFSEAGGLVFQTTITLDEGYDQNVQFDLEGEHAQWFTLQVQGNSATLTVSGAIPPATLVNNHQLVFFVTAQKPNSNTARATIVISLVDGAEEVEAFDKVLYEGTIRLNVVQHESITVIGYTGNNVEIFGDYRDLFTAAVSEGTVVVEATGSLGLPEHVTHVALELRTGRASAVLLLNVLESETPELPSVNFGSPSYVLRADVAQTGLVGQVSATASNGESVTYSLAVNDAHLQERVSVNNNGEIHLSAPTNTGVYSFQVIATSIITQVQATASVQLTVDAVVVCGDDDHVLQPLIILDRDEEEPHENLVVLNSTTQPGCQFRLTNRWPLDQDWLYVDENGLHARSIDREDPRIAFMALSQVQVEIVLECSSDTHMRAKRSINMSSRLDWLGPYDYGNNKWILTDTILYNSRRSFVNLIVNDINDNYPIFVGKENEPIVVGYPIRELEDVVLPRALAELKATDADVGENATLMFWSSEEVLAVAPTTGSVHVRDGASLTHDEILTVSVTDRNGQDGLTSTVQLLVKLIDIRHIAVVTVRNAFLDQEETILSNLSAAVGYEVKVLSSAVISDDTDLVSANTRNKREVTSAEGASLQLYVYGVIDREPVTVEQLSTDISESVLSEVDVASTVSLEDHLENRGTGGGRDVGLLVSTIVLSVLLFILIMTIVVWFILKWRKAQNYEQFSDANSVASRNEPLEQPPKVESLKRPRLNLEELKKSERRLQEMLEAPVDQSPAKPSTSTVDPEGVFDTIINMAPPDTTMPIVIQSIDRLKDDANSGDEDEFGERTNKSRRKSIVTFNENVEKIIHVENLPDDDNYSDIEVFKF